jgi:glycosyltransferase involved in cell wall biosynthesis
MTVTQKKKVHVLLSTYNGESYLEELLDSLIAQSCRADHITIRDDGSTDGTQQLLAGFAAERRNVTLVSGKRLGATQSFLTLLAGSDTQSDYFAFCDQDDVWRPVKLQDAMEMLEQHSSDEALLYCSAIEYVDGNLRHLGHSRRPHFLELENALVENVATGCTIVLNRTARDLLVKELPHKPLLHDWWCYIVISALGRVIYDPRPNVGYRLHSRNAIGSAMGFRRRLVRRLTRFWNSGLREHKFAEQASLLYDAYGPMLTSRQRQIVKRFLDMRKTPWSRVRYALEAGLVRQSLLDTAILRLLIGLGRV